MREICSSHQLWPSHEAGRTHMHKRSDLVLPLDDLARQSPLVVYPHHLDLLQHPPHREPFRKRINLPHFRHRHREDLGRQTEAELLGRTPDRVPQHARLDLLPDFEVRLRVLPVEVEEVDRAVKVAEELDVQAGGEGRGDEGGDEVGWEDGGDGSGGGELRAVRVSCWPQQRRGGTNGGADDFGAADSNGAGTTVLAYVLDAAADELTDFEARRLELLRLLEGKERGEGGKAEGEDVAVIFNRVDRGGESLQLPLAQASHRLADTDSRSQPSSPPLRSLR